MDFAWRRPARAKEAFSEVHGSRGRGSLGPVAVPFWSGALTFFSPHPSPRLTSSPSFPFLHLSLNLSFTSLSIRLSPSSPRN